MKTYNLNWTHLLELKDFDQHRKLLDESGGIYLWLWKDPRDVAYVGEASRFGNRFVQHFTSMMAGSYVSYRHDPGQAHVEFLKKHCGGKTIQDLKAEKKVYWPASYNDGDYFQNMFLDEDRQKVARDNLKRTLFAFAPLRDEAFHNRKEIEAALIMGVAKYYQEQAKGVSLFPNINWNRRLPIGRISRTATEPFQLIQTTSSLELPEYLTRITSFAPNTSSSVRTAA